MLYIGNTRYKVANKPYDAEIEYLKNNGKAYIDTGIKMHKWYGMGCTFAVTKHANSTWCIFCGSRTTFYYSLNWTVGSNGIITLVFDYLSGGSLGSGSTGLTYGDKMTFESRPDMSTMKMNAYFNGVYKSQTNLPTTDQAQTVNNWCFTSNNEWRTQESRIYEYWITDQTGKRIIDLIPVRKGTTGYMYDKVSGKLYGNSGTGTFTLGPDKYDSEVQYIESTGTQYINTGIGFTESLSTRMQFCLTKLNSNNQLLYGAWADNSSYPKTQFLTNSSNVFAPVYETEYVSARLTDTGSIINGTAAYSNKFYDVTVFSPAQSESTLNCYLFARDNDVNNYLPYNGLRLYACKMTQNGVVVRDFIPVRKNGVGYLYDKISDQLFGNIGTGNFIIGPDINIHTRRIVTNSVIIQPYITDGLVFHLDGSDFDSQNMKWTDKIGNIVFNMYNVSLYNGKGVKFNGNTNSYGRSSTIVNYSYTTSTIEIVQYRYAQSGFVFDPANVNAIRYIQGGSYVNFTYGAASKRSGISTQSLNKISTHSINMDRDVFNGTSYNFVSNDTWSASSSNTYLGIRNGTSYPLNGIIYQIRIYNRKLSLQEILYNQEQDKKRYGIIF